MFKKIIATFLAAAVLAAPLAAQAGILKVKKDPNSNKITVTAGPNIYEVTPNCSQGELGITKKTAAGFSSDEKTDFNTIIVFDKETGHISKVKSTDADVTVDNGLTLQGICINGSARPATDVVGATRNTIDYSF